MLTVLVVDPIIQGAAIQLRGSVVSLNLLAEMTLWIRVRG